MRQVSKTLGFWTVKVEVRHCPFKRQNGSQTTPDSLIGTACFWKSGTLLGRLCAHGTQEGTETGWRQMNDGKVPRNDPRD